MKKENEYTTDKIKKLTEIESIRKNSGLYIGSSVTPLRLFEECLDNSLDEALAGFCTNIGVFIDTKENSFSIIDNGRGFPFDEKLPLMEDPPVFATTSLYTSGKFEKDDKQSAYDISIGLHGFGLVVCFALSKKMEISIYRDQKYAEYKFKNGDIEKIKRKIVKLKNSEKPFSTKVKIFPDKKYFDTVLLPLKEIEERLRLACVNIPYLKIYLKIDDKEILISGDEKKLILDFLTKNEIEWFSVDIQKEKENCSLKFGWEQEGALTPKIFSCVNLIKVDYGVHITKISNIFQKIFSTLGKRKKYEFKPQDSLIGLRVYLNLKIIKTSFEAQVKVKLESKTDLSIMNSLENKLFKFFEENEDLTNKLLEQFQLYRKTIDAKTINVNNKNSSKKSISKYTKLRDCKYRDGELFIVEGDSAAGGIIRRRDSFRHAVFPMKGKSIPNIITKKDALKNVEISELILCLGTGIEPQFNINDLRYGKIILAQDADADGYHIACLLIMIFAMLTPELIKQGKIYLAKTPLYCVNDKNKKIFVPLWSEEEVEKARNQNFPITRFKGLGEFDPWQLEKCLLDENTRNIYKLEFTNELENLVALFSDSELKRKLLEEGEQWTI